VKKTNHPIFFSTGIFRVPLAERGCTRFRDPTITMLREHQTLSRLFQGIDVGLRRPEDILDLDFSKENENFIASYELNTCHFPYEYVITDSAETEALLQKLPDIFRRLRIRYTVIHPQCITDINYLWRRWEELDLGEILIENWIRVDHVSHEHFESLFINDKINIVLDTCHAGISTCAQAGYPFSYFMPRFEDRIKFVHLSGNKSIPPYQDPDEPEITRFCSGHHFLHTLSTLDLAYIEPVWILLQRKQNIGIIIEVTAQSLDQFPGSIEKEVAFIHDKLGHSVSS